VEPYVEVVEYPLAVDIVRRVFPGDSTLEDPMANQAAEPWIVASGSMGANGRDRDGAKGGKKHQSLHGSNLAKIKSSADEKFVPP